MFNLAVTATASENDGDTASISTSVSVDVPEIEGPDLTVVDAQGDDVCKAQHACARITQRLPLSELYIIAQPIRTAAQQMEIKRQKRARA